MQGTPIPNPLHIKNNSLIASIFNNFIQLGKRLPNPNLTEVVSIDECLSCKLATDVIAEAEYPDVALSRTHGYMMNIKHDITTIEELRTIKQLSRNPEYGRILFKPDTTQDFRAYVDAHIKIGNIANTLIGGKDLDGWTFDDYEKYELKELKPLTIGLGMIEKGADYKTGQVILEKGTIITPPQKALLRQAKVTQVQIYKRIKIAVVCVAYDLEELNSDLEFAYIQDCMKSWGYEFDVIKIKPGRYEMPQIVLSEEDRQLSTDMKTLIDRLNDIANTYDYSIACGINLKNGQFSQIGLERTGLLRGEIFPIMSVGRKSRLIMGDLKRPRTQEYCKYYNEQGLVQATILKQYEDRGIIHYASGGLLDIIVNMHVAVRPILLHRIHNKPYQPQWEIGVLGHDYEYKEDHYNAILWASASDIFYDVKPGYHRQETVPELKIIELDESRQDKINFMKECNCFIAIEFRSEEDKILKKGDLFYYLKI